jgi:PiT family inorganic phosphate transporter
MLSLLGGIFLGWSLGANDASNVFGSAVASRMLRFWNAALLASLFVVLGSLLEGQTGIETLRNITPMALKEATVSSVAAAATVTLMTFLRLPVSTSQAVVGAILGIAVLNRTLNIPNMGKIVACWLGTPLGGLVIAFFIYRIAAFIYNHLRINLFQSDRILRIALIITGAYGAYALGANNVANVTAVYVAAGVLTPISAVLLGGVSIALGIMTFSRRVMETVGRQLVRLDPFSALVVVMAEAITVHIYTFVGVPVSTSQAVIGAVLGIGIIKGIKTVGKRTLINILLGWFLTPVVAMVMAIGIYFIIHLHYIRPVP